MGQKFLMDTNAIIGYLSNILPQEGMNFMESLTPTISVISKIELLGWYNVSTEDLTKLTAFVNTVDIYPLNEIVVNKAIELKQSYKIKTPDAVIAATAISNNLTLMTRNVKDFKSLKLDIIDPWKI